MTATSPRTDTQALREFIRANLDADRVRFQEALDRGDRWVATSPTGLTSTRLAVDDLPFLGRMLWEHSPTGPGLCRLCSAARDTPIAHPCRSILGMVKNRWSDRPGWWPGWDPEFTPRPPGDGARSEETRRRVLAERAARGDGPQLRLVAGGQS